ncbi:MAG: hypothetical protein ACW991_00705 [Candidatus Hodarchaeales archaeon]|jgi:hypothetical protein
MVTINNVFSDSFDQIYDLLVNNTVDPRNKDTWVRAAFPDEIAESKDLYPIIILNPINASDSEPLSVNYAVKTFALELNVEIYALNPEDLDSLSDQVLLAIESNEATLYDSGIYNFELSNVDSDTINRGEIRIYRKTIEWNFEFRKAS